MSVNILSPREASIFLEGPENWSCNCGKPLYTRFYSDLKSYTTIVCQCGHELTKSEYDIYNAKWRVVQMEKQTVGEKYDVGKPRMDLLLDFTKALTAVAELATIGAEKYAAHGWINVKDGEERYTAALLRHLFIDEETDQDTGVLHDTAVAWNALARLELKLRTVKIREYPKETIDHEKELAKFWASQSPIYKPKTDHIPMEPSHDMCSDQGHLTCSICNALLFSDGTCPECSGDHDD